MIPPKKLIPLLLAAAGLIASVAAIFATALGLDQNTDWSRARIGLLLFGITLMLCAALYYKYTDQIHSAIYFAQVVFGDIPQWIITGFTVAIVIIIYVWFASSGRCTFWKSNTYYYDGLARGFLSGHLYLPIEPDPKLLELPDPYNYPERIKAQVESPVDFSLYQGKFYLYWGPIPALLLAALYQISRGKVSDLILTFGFICGTFFIQTTLMYAIWNRYFKDLPRWTLHISTLAIGLIGPVILLRHSTGGARIYQAAISGAQFFFMAGLLMTLIMFNEFLLSNWRLALVGLFFALAIGTRLTTALPAGFIILLLAFWIFKTDASFPKKMAHLVFLGAPLLFGFLALGWYNWARFGSVTENGITYMLAGWYSQKYLNVFFSRAYVFQNMYNFLFYPPIYSLEFPFVFMTGGTSAPAFSFYSVPDTYMSIEIITGLLPIFPFILFSALPLLMLIIHRGASTGTANTGDQKRLSLIVLGLGGSFILPFALLMTFLWAAMRYTGDFMPSLTALSVIGFWQGYQFFSPRPLAGKLYTVIAVALICVSILLGMFLLISTDSGLIHKLVDSIKVAL